MVSLEEVEAELAEGDVLEEVEDEEDEENDGELDAAELAELRPMDATQLRTEDLIAEMERRHLHPKGFLTDDAKELQKYFDKEYEQDLEKIRVEKREQRKREREKVQLHKKRMQLEKQLKDEEAAVHADGQISTWLEVIRTNATPSHSARIRCDSVTVRALAKALWINTSLTALDLSRNALSDFAGAQIARVLKRNRALLKLELSENKLGPRSCHSFGEWLPATDVLKTLDLDSNPLAAHDDASGFIALARALRINKSLTAVSIWRCNVGYIGGSELALALQQNHSITALEVGYNDMYHDNIKIIVDRLDANREALAARNAKMAQAQRDADAEQRAADAVEEQKRKATALATWMTQQRDNRALERIAVAEDIRLKRYEAERMRLLEEARRRDENRAREEATKKKKGAKTKKKGKSKK